jgi:endonuclease YncB( thermonuclease family)
MDQRGVRPNEGGMATGPTGTPEHVVQDPLQALERTAREHQRGIWVTSTAGPTAQTTP